MCAISLLQAEQVEQGETLSENGSEGFDFTNSHPIFCVASAPDTPSSLRLQIHQPHSMR